MPRTAACAGAREFANDAKDLRHFGGFEGDRQPEVSSISVRTACAFRGIGEHEHELRIQRAPGVPDSSRSTFMAVSKSAFSSAS